LAFPGHPMTSDFKRGPTSQDYLQLIASIERMLHQFEIVRRETPEMFWWSIEVNADITRYPDVALTAWAEVLQAGYDPDLVNLGGIGTKNLDKWTLYGVSGNCVTVDEYAQVADACIATVHALWLPAIVPSRRGAGDELFVFQRDPQWDRFQVVKRTTWCAPSDEQRWQGYRMLWPCDEGDSAISLSDYIDRYPIQHRGRKGLSSAPIGGSYWTSIWFESLFGTAPAIGLGAFKGRQLSQYEEIVAGSCQAE